MSQRLYSQYTQDDQSGGLSQSKRAKTVKKIQKYKGTRSLSAGAVAQAVRRELYKKSETKHCNLAGNEVAINTINTGTGLSFLSQPYPTVGAEVPPRIVTGKQHQPTDYEYPYIFEFS